MVDAPVNYGTSGGGVFDARSGRLVGIVRGYRTVRMSVPGNTDAALTLPVAGETTVIPTEDILCFLADHDLVRQLFDSTEIARDCAAR
jgi:S1-C subfamily serine protease